MRPVPVVVATPPPPGVRPFTLILVLVFGLLGGFLLYRVWDRGTPGVDPRPITPAGDLAADEKASVQLFQQTSPSVVNITTLGLTTDLYRRSVEVPQGTGTGFLWDDAGHVVTNFHVVRNATGATITLADHSQYEATAVGAAPQYDLAVLKITAPASGLRQIPFIGSRGDLQGRQKGLPIGKPFGVQAEPTTRIVPAGRGPHPGGP